jgi:hypothetical protein
MSVDFRAALLSALLTGRFCLYIVLCAVCSEGLEGGHMSAATCVAPLAWPLSRAANCRITILILAFVWPYEFLKL